MGCGLWMPLVKMKGSMTDLLVGFRCDTIVVTPSSRACRMLRKILRRKMEKEWELITDEERAK